MIPTAQAIQETAKLRQGDLGEVPFATLLCSLAAHERSAVLEIRRRQLRKEIVFEHGVPVDCRSNLAHETLGRFMVAQGRLQPDELTSTLSESLSRGVPLGEVLRERGLIEPFELYRLLQQNLAKKLLDGFTWRDGEFRVHEDLPEVGSPLKVRVPQLVVTGITRFAPAEMVDLAVAPLRQGGLEAADSPRFALDELRLTPEQRHVVNLLGQGWRVADLAAAAQIPDEEIDRLVYALTLLGMVVPRPVAAGAPDGAVTAPAPVATEPAAGEPPPAVAADEPPPADPAPVDRAEVERLRNEVMQAYLSYRKQDAFDLLGLADEADAAAVRAAYLRFAERFAPWRFAAGGLGGLADKARDLFLAGAAAYGELLDPEKRDVLIHRRRSVLEPTPEAEPAPSLRIETDLLDSEKQFDNGRALMEEGSYGQALTLLEFAADCDPQNVLYRSEAAHCRFLAHPEQPREARRALSELSEALRIDPGFGLAAYYAGLIHLETGAPERAEPLLRRANQLMAPDRRPIEALKRLKRERKKR